MNTRGLSRCSSSSPEREAFSRAPRRPRSPERLALHAAARSGAAAAQRGHLHQRRRAAARRPLRHVPSPGRLRAVQPADLRGREAARLADREGDAGPADAAVEGRAADSVPSSASIRSATARSRCCGAGRTSGAAEGESTRSAAAVRSPSRGPTAGSSARPISSSRCRRPTRCRRRAPTPSASSSSRCRRRCGGTCAGSSSGRATRASCITPTSASIARRRRGGSTKPIPAPGYDGLIARTAEYPDGHFLGWTPGQAGPLLPKGLAWTLEPDTDLVVELHMQPSGKTGDGRAVDRPVLRRRPARADAGDAAARTAGHRHPRRRRALRRERLLRAAGGRRGRRAAAARALPRAPDPRRGDAAGRLDEDAARHQRLGLPLAARLPLRNAAARCRRARRCRCSTPTTTPRRTRATPSSRRPRAAGASARRRRWATSGSRC